MNTVTMIGQRPGVVLLDKPLGMSSNRALQKVKRALGAKKAGHGGTLDPLATGMLPICLGDATKFCQYMLAADKLYQTTMKLGELTTTGDAEGEVIATKPCQHIERAHVEALIPRFMGVIEQIPSMYSALKHNGVPLYKLARQGIEIERPSRQITIYQLSIDAFEWPMVTLTVKCSKGTYIRSLVEDIGHALGVGAHVIALRRCAVSPFQQHSMVTLDEVIEAPESTEILPVSNMINHLQPLEVNDQQLRKLSHGQTVSLPMTMAPNELCMLTHPQHGCVGVGSIVEPNLLKAKRLINACIFK